MGDVTFSGASLVIIGTLLSALVGAIGVLFRLLMASKDSSLKEANARADSFQKMAAQSISALELAANRARKARGEEPFQSIPPVVPEHHSPPTPAQQAEADYQTLLARAAAAARLLDIPIAKLSEDVHPKVIGAEPDEEASPGTDGKGNADPATKPGADPATTKPDSEPGTVTFESQSGQSLTLQPGESVTIQAEAVDIQIAAKDHS